MKTRIGWPDDSPPGVRWVVYNAFCFLNRHPAVYRVIGAALRRWPVLSQWWAVPARRDAVAGVLLRPTSFLNTSHHSNLAAGEFMIGMEPGPRYDEDKAFFGAMMPSLRRVQRLANLQARRSIDLLRARPGRTFDLIDDYLMEVVFRAIESAFRSAAPSLAAGSRDGGAEPDPALERRYLLELRHVAAHLFAGRLAPLDVVRRAEVCAESLRQRVGKLVLDIRYAIPNLAVGTSTETIRRGAVGMAWVSHPVTVQSGALAVQELLGRPKQWSALQARAEALGTGSALWGDQAFRDEVRKHVMEAMRFRPVFPLLARDVPRDTLFDVGEHRQASCPAGSSVTVLTLSAMFDPRSVADPGAYCPHRDWGLRQGDRFMMFGFGERQCPGRFHAVEMLTSAMVGLLSLPDLKWGADKAERMVYDGPMMTRMLLRFGA